MQYRREVDGLRAVAVLPVILFHAGFSVFSGGYVGVDVFFVISGYLITSILISELEQNNFSIARFYERRARRILPALFLVMFACLPFAYMWMLPSQLTDFAFSLVAVVFFASNVLFWREDGYFAAAAELKPLLHTWSLAVEEQYYLLFPIFLLLLWRFGRQRVLWTVMAVAVASLLLAEWGWRNMPSANFYLAPTRAWELLAGSICAFMTVGRPQRSSNMLSAVGLAMIMFAIFVYDEETPFPSVYALVPVVGTMLIILFAAQGTWVARLLSLPAFVGIGLISYSAYLWHQPLFAFARLRSLTEPGHMLMGALAVASLLLAWATWRYVEQPFRKRANPLLVTQRHVFAVSGAVGAVFVAVGLAGHHFHAELRRLWLHHNPDVAHIYTLIEDARTHAQFGATEGTAQKLANCVFNVTKLTEEVEAKILDCKARYGEGVLILGDSHAIDLFGMVASAFDTEFLIGVTQGNCRPHTLYDFCQYPQIAQFLQRHPGVLSSALYTQAGFYLLLDENGGKGSRNLFSPHPLNHSIENLTVDVEYVEKTYDYLLELSNYTKVTWFGSRIEPHVPQNILLRAGCDGKFVLRPGQAEAFLMLDQHIGRLVANGGKINYVSQVDVVKLDMAKDYITCDTLYFSDGDHYSAAGEVRFGSRLPKDFLPAHPPN